MIDHVSLYVSDYEKGKEFYSKALAPLGYKIHMDMPEHKVAGLGAASPDIWLVGKPGQGKAHIALHADSKEVVNAFHKAALEAGAKDNGAPGYRKEYTPGYYGAFIHDADDNNFEVVWHDPNPPQN